MPTLRKLVWKPKVDSLANTFNKSINPKKKQKKKKKKKRKKKKREEEDKTEGKYYNYNTLVHLEPSLVDTQNGSRFCLHKINIRNCITTKVKKKTQLPIRPITHFHHRHKVEKKTHIYPKNLQQKNLFHNTIIGHLKREHLENLTHF
jgi:hypothetical protein